MSYHMWNKLIEREFNKAKERKWDKIYIAVDFHDTIFKSTYQHNELEYLGMAKEALQYLSTRKDVVLIGWSSLSEETYNLKYKPIFDKDEIKFQYFNENPLEKGTKYADFSRKFYFSLLIDDKSGYNPYEDWVYILEIMLLIPELK